MDLANCPRCGKLFARHFRDVCPDCLKRLEKEYEACVDYLRDHKGATINELSEETEVTIKQITRFIREGRISLVGAPNLSYPCEVCGILIRDGNMCDSCRGRLNRDVRNATSNDNSKASSAAQDYRSGGAYRIGDRIRDRD